MAGQHGFWDFERRLRERSAQGDPLETLGATVDLEMLRPALLAAMGRRVPRRGGRLGFDPVLKFRMLVLQPLHGLSLEQTEYLLRDQPRWTRPLMTAPGCPRG